MTFFEKVKRFLEPLLESKLYLTLSLAKFCFWAFYSIAVVILIKATLDDIIRDDVGSYTHHVYIFTTFIVIYFLINYIGRKWEWPTLYYITEKHISDTYVRKLMMLDNNYIETLGTGKLVSIVQSGIKRWNEQLSFLLRDLSRTFIVFIVTTYILLSMDYVFGGLFIVVIFLIHIAVVWIDGFARDARKIRTERRTEYSRKLVQIIMSKNEIIQNNQMEARAKELYTIHESIEEADTNVAYSLFFIFNIPRFSLALGRIGILYFIGYSVFEGALSLTDFTLAMTILLMFETFLIDSVETFKNSTKDFSDIEKFWAVIDNGPKMKGYSTGSPFTPNKEDIIIRGISYGYGESRVFEDFSLTIKRGKKTALVGASGGGKTTLMKLIAGYLHPESGSISVMGNALSETALKTYYPHIGYLTQDPSVFDATIRENLVSAISSVSVMSTESSDPVTTTRHLAQNLSKTERDFSPIIEADGIRNDKNPETSRINSSVSSMTVSVSQDEKLTRALRLAHCDFVFELEKGLDTEIGERGVRLSGGQKQRLAIAKIFLKDPEIILLDEPTSALDSFSEEKITEALDTLFQDRTVIIIAHRLQTVKKADDIIVIEGGSVIERGDHDDLVKKKGIYAKMLELQSGF